MERTNKYYRQDTSAGVDERTSPPITSNRYEIGMPIGSGAWGIVYDAKDNVLNQDELAIKVLDMSQLAKAQMEYRGLTPLEVMIKDGGKLAACSRIVPRRLEFDNNNVPFLVMPQYQRHLSDILEDKDQETGEMNPVEQRRYLNHGLDKEQIKSYLSDFALAYREFHTILGRAHGDGKPENIPVDNKHKFALFNDLGSSTYLAQRKDGKPRDNIGFLYTRAYELFKEKRKDVWEKDEDVHPDERSDVFTFASLAYRLFTGKYLWEDELQGVKDPDKYFEELGSEKIGSVLKKKMKKVPRSFRKFLRKCASSHKYERPANGEDLMTGLEKVLKREDRMGMIKDGLAKHLPKAVWPLSLGALLVIGSLLPEPKDTIPVLDPSKYDSLLVMDRMPQKDPMFFEAEDPASFPAQILKGFMVGNYNLRGFTGNKNVLVLLNNYASAHDVVRENMITDEQMAIYLHNTPEYERTGSVSKNQFTPVIKSIEYAMNYPGVKHENGRYDLEDICTIARVGPAKFKHAKEMSGSKDFAAYVDARDNAGNRIITEEDALFIKTWLGYLHENNR